MKRIDIMVDLETLGTDVDSPIFQIGAVAFDIKTGKEISTFNKIADIGSESLLIEGSTLKWWLKTDANLFNKLINWQSSNMDTEDLLNAFDTWISYEINGIFYEINGIYLTKPEVTLWGNGIGFDNVMLKNQMNNYPIKYNKDRDVRTIVDLTATKLGITEKELKDKIPKIGDVHNALDDAKWQVELVHFCYKTLVLE